MSDLEAFPDKESSRPLSEKERRQLLEKRIKELRKRKRKQRSGSGEGPRHLFLILVVLAFFLLCVFSSLFTFYDRGGNQSYLTLDIPALNQAEIEGLAKAPGQIVEPAISAYAAFLMDPQTGDVLYSKHPDQPLPMASTTKIMTAAVTLEHASLQDSVTISENAVRVGESSAWLGKGETLSVEQLLYALLIQSANDAAVALAEYVGGSIEVFCEMMNEKARELGTINTHFSNPHGLDQEGHYTSARDLAIMSAYALRNELFREIVKSRNYQIPWPGHPDPRVLENHNKLLEMYPYATGIKTGYTLDAGRCLVASAAHDGRELISVILNGGDTFWNQSIQLMEYGFNSFTRVEYAYPGQSLAKVSVGDFPRAQVNAVPREDLVFTVRRDYITDILNATVYYNEWMPYPASAGQEVGYVTAAEGSTHELRGVLVSDASRAAPNIVWRFFAFIAAIISLWWKGIKWLLPGL